MIEITHKQAQHLIREGLDRPLPDAQWAMLQSHLERCAECSAYRDRITASQRGLTHALRLRWSGARGPKPGATKFLVDRHERLVKQRKWIVRASRYALGLMVVVAFLVYRSLNTPPPPPVERATPTPLTGGQGQSAAIEPAPMLIFHGLVAFEEEQDGNAEIVLLNVSGGQVDRSNLTNAPSAERHPAWSPDGEWIAFLSDRSGKNEVYLMSVAGSRLTQITAAPGIEWQGPLEWSADGEWIALAGLRAEAGGDPFLYLVPTAGGVPRTVALTRGALPWARFSPSEPLLAYPSPQPGGGILVVNVETGQMINLYEAETGGTGAYPVHMEGFDWALGGKSLIYPAASDPDGEQGPSWLRISPELDASDLRDSQGTDQEIASKDDPEGFRAVTAVPNSLLVASLENSATAGCWILRLDHAYNRMVAARRLTDLCVEGSLESANWTGDGNWLVLLARRPGENRPAIYAVRLPGDDNEAPLYERLGDANLIAGSAGLPPGPSLRVRKIGRRLALDPQPAAEAAQGETGAVPAPAGEDDWIYTVVNLGESGEIRRARPDGSAVELVAGSDEDSGVYYRCPRVGPDGRVAFITNLGRVGAGTTDIFVMDGGGQNKTLLTTEDGKFFQCPVWSPDGSRIAAFAFDTLRAETTLAVFSVDGSGTQTAAPVFLPVELTGLSEPVWLPNDPANPALGSDRLLVAAPQGRSPARLMEYDLRKPEGEREEPVELAMFPGWDDVWGVTLSPDGQRLAMMLLFYNRRSGVSGPSTGQLRVMDVAYMETQALFNLSRFYPDTVGMGSLAWLANDRVGLIRSSNLAGNEKSIFETVLLAETGDRYRLFSAASFPDVVYDAAWKRTAAMPGAQAPAAQTPGTLDSAAAVDPARVEWAAFTSESGLWVLDLRALGSEAPLEPGSLVPAQIGAEQVYELDWR